MTSLKLTIYAVFQVELQFFLKSNFGELKLQKWLPDISVGQHYTVQEK